MDDDDEFEIMMGVADMMFIKYKCVQCGIYVYKCEACEEYFFVRTLHYCYFERRYLLQELFPPDEGFHEECQILDVDCTCRHPCDHNHLIKIRT